MKHMLIAEQQLLKHTLIAEQQLLKTGKWPRQWPFSGFRFSATCFRPDVSGYRVKRGMTYARTSIKTGCHHAAIQAVGSRHYAPCRGVTPLQSRRSQVVITQKCGIQSKTSYPTDVLWIPRQARYDNYRPPGLRHGVSRV